MYKRITNITLCPGVPDGEPLTFIEGACIDIRDGVIEYAGKGEGAPATIGCEFIDGGGCLAVPGLANAHTHAAMSLLRGLGSDLRLQDWLTKKIFPAEDRLTADDVYVGAQIAFVEMLRYGVTASADMYMFPDEVCDAAEAVGIRVAMCYPATGQGSDDGGSIEKGADLLRRRHNTANGRVRIMLGAHAEYTSSPDIIRALAEKARDLGASIHAHVSETRAEVEGCFERHGVSPVKYFADLGLFDQPALAAHCVYLSDADIDILAAKGVFVAHNPVSNLKLASGVAPVPAMLNAGVRVCLGTDGSASNNTLNLWEEIRLMSILHKGISGDPASISPSQTFHAATLAGMRAMGFERVGLLVPGWRADIALIDRSGPHHWPILEPAGDLVYSTQGADVRMTIVDGIVRYIDGKFPGLDTDDLKKRACVAARRLTDGLIGGAEPIDRA
ncbi:MAG: amidohydrolase [Oscillospiraceae bacterium]|jgi:5-methylthioadenosine/S-adenosylhomocysteine deaminase|nr:amidohydrolase [Oscillospiraceae bacterium]